MTAPGNYNDAALTIRVHPLRLHWIATVDIPAQVNVIIDSIERVVQIWTELKLGWAGRTAQEAEDFGRRWTAAIVQLFGTKDNQDLGAITRLWKSAAIAAINYGVTEDTIKDMFEQLEASLSPGHPTSAAPPRRGGPDGSVIQQTPEP